MSEIINGEPIVASNIDTFLELTDTLPAYTGHGGKVVKVAVTEDALEFAAESGGATVLNDLTDVNIVTPGLGDVIRYNPSTNKFEKHKLFLMEEMNINLNNSMSAAVIQAELDKIPILNAHIVNIQFADGIYDLDDHLNIVTNSLGGVINVLGNQSENHLTLHSNQAVFLDFSSSSHNFGLAIANTVGIVNVFNLKIKVNDGQEYVQCGIYHADFTNSRICGNYIYGAGNNGVSCIWGDHAANVFARANYFGLSKIGMYAQYGSVFISHTNDDIGGGNQPKFGLFANASRIYKHVTQPTGSISNEKTSGGGQIS